MRNKNAGMPDEARGKELLLEELLRRASKDALSGLLNRATMERSIKERLKAMEPEETCALFIVDLDNFKQINDTLGHRAGDQAIRQAGRILSGLFHASDVVGRLGGDEFVVLICEPWHRKTIEAKFMAYTPTSSKAPPPSSGFRSLGTSPIR